MKGRLTGLTTSHGTNTYGYSSTTGQLTTISTLDGIGQTYGYDGSLLKDITWSGPVSGNVHGAMTINRDPATGFVTSTTLGMISESRTYDVYGAEQTYTVTANGNTLYSVNYATRDALGRIVNKTETIQGTTHVYGYTYDGTGV